MQLPAGPVEWRAPARVFCSTRCAEAWSAGGTRHGPYAAGNLGLAVGDACASVHANRRGLRALLGVERLQWLTQVHGAEHVEVTRNGLVGAPEVDAVWTRAQGVGLAIQTADCVAVGFAARDGGLIAAAHVGWRGLVAGVLPRLLDALPCPSAHLDAVIGPAIGAGAYEVGGEVVAGIESAGLDPRARRSGTQATDADAARFHIDLAGLVRAQLGQCGVETVLGGHWCTLTDARFFSHRRAVLTRGSQAPTGRQVLVVWLPAADQGR